MADITTFKTNLLQAVLRLSAENVKLCGEPNRNIKFQTWFDVLKDWIWVETIILSS